MGVEPADGAEVLEGKWEGMLRGMVGVRGWVGERGEGDCG